MEYASRYRCLPVGALFILFSYAATCVGLFTGLHGGFRRVLSDAYLSVCLCMRNHG